MAADSIRSLPAAAFSLPGDRTFERLPAASNYFLASKTGRSAGDTIGTFVARFSPR
jgi:hypothetical protein